MQNPRLTGTALLVVLLVPGGAAAALLTDRLSPKQLRCWHAIERVVFATDEQGGPRHPTLRGLWERVDESGHAIHIELPETPHYVPIIAGQFRVERVDPAGLAHVAALRLNRESIDRANPGPPTPDAGFARFSGLDRVERYAEVLGHELAHVLWTLATPDRARHVLRLQEELEALGRALRSAVGEARDAVVARLVEVDARAEGLEGAAYATEARVLAELAGQAATSLGLSAARIASAGLGSR